MVEAAANCSRLHMTWSRPVPSRTTIPAAPRRIACSAHHTRALTNCDASGRAPSHGARRRPPPPSRKGRSPRRFDRGSAKSCTKMDFSSADSSTWTRPDSTHCDESAAVDGHTLLPIQAMARPASRGCAHARCTTWSTHPNGTIHLEFELELRPEPAIERPARSGIASDAPP